MTGELHQRKKLLHKVNFASEHVPQLLISKSEAAITILSHQLHSITNEVSAINSVTMENSEVA